MLGSSLWEHWHMLMTYTVLLAPTPSSMRKLLQIFEQYAQEYSVTSNANISKCIVAAPRNCRRLLLRGNICPFVIDGNSIDFVDSFPHLGHIISSEPGDNEDISHSRCKFIGQTNSQGWSPRGLSSTSRTPRGQKSVALALASMLSGLGLGLDLEHAKPKHAKSLQGLHFDSLFS